MPIQIQGYQQRREIGQGVGLPAVRPATTETGLGEAIQSAAGKLEAAYEKVTREAAETESLAAAAQTRMALEEEYRKAQEVANPGAASFTPNFMKTVDDAIASSAGKLTNDAARKRFRERMTGYQVSVQERALGWEVGERISKRTRDFQTSADDNANSLYTVDGTARDLTYRNLQNDLNESLDAVGLPPSVRDQLRDEAKNKMSYAAVQGDLRDRPAKVQDWLVKGIGADYYSKLRFVESGGRNIGSDSSSAFGPYQFTKGTWSDLIKRHPELNLTEEDRFKPQAQEIGIRAFTADNAELLKAAGIKLTNVNMRMAHFLGAGGALRFFRAGLTDEARNHVTQDAVKANPAIFKPGRTVADVLNLFAKQFGESVEWNKQSDAPGYYADIPFVKRDQLYSAAETEMNKRRSRGEAAFQQRVQNAISEYAANGAAVNPPSENDFVAALGANRGTVDYGEYAANSRAAASAYRLQRMPLNEHAGFIENLKPKQGDPFFAEKQVGYEKVKVIGEQIRNQVTQDFGQHVISQNEVAASLLATAFDPEKTQNEAAAAADQYAQIIQAEANRLNVPASNRSLLPKSYSNTIAATMNQQLTSDADAKAKVAALTAYADRWGSRWPSVYREMKDGLSAPVQVITSRIKDRAAIALASVHDKSFDELSKVAMGKGDAKNTVQNDIQDAFQPFLISTQWQQSSLPGVGVFMEQAKKLAAVYIGQGMSVGSAAEEAYNDLIGFKFRMVDDRGVNVRIPVEADTEGLEYFLKQERGNILSSPRIAASAEELKQDPEATIRLRDRLIRDSKWVTLPDNTGVGLLYQGALRTDKDGKPLVLTWDEVKMNADKYWDFFKLNPFDTYNPAPNR